MNLGDPNLHGHQHDDAAHLVVMNDEEQYSTWPSDKELPAGWRATGFAGTRQACLDHIEQVWVDMVPRSARVPKGWD